MGSRYGQCSTLTVNIQQVKERYFRKTHVSILCRIVSKTRLCIPPESNISSADVNFFTPKVFVFNNYFNGHEITFWRVIEAICSWCSVRGVMLNGFMKLISRRASQNVVRKTVGKRSEIVIWRNCYHHNIWVKIERGRKKVVFKQK